MFSGLLLISSIALPDILFKEDLNDYNADGSKENHY